MMMHMLRLAKVVAASLAVVTDSMDVNALLSQGHYLLQQASYSDAAQMYQQVLQSQPQNDVALHNLGLVALASVRTYASIRERRATG
jgi:hypothetical protein